MKRMLLILNQFHEPFITGFHITDNILSLTRYIFHLCLCSAVLYVFCS